MIYLGTYLRAAGHSCVEPALIDPKLPTAAAAPGYRGEDMPYWPSYSEISPAARGVYLRWLQGGRSDPTIAIGIVFLFFYGLERRLLVDSAACSPEEVVAILLELRRLLSIYGANRSFQGYATALLDLVEAISSNADSSAPPAPRRGSATACLKVRLGRRANAGAPLPADWALAWVESDVEYWPRTPAQRCRDDFVTLFRIRFRERYGEGCPLKISKARVRLEYQPSSASFSGPVSVSLEQIPDVTVLKEPIAQLRSLAEQCTDELDAYSRYIGRNPGERNSPAALALLPADLVREHEGEQVAPIRRWLEATVVEGRFQTIDLNDLTRVWPELNRDRFGKRETVMLAQFFEKLGFGMEPDARFGSSLPRSGGKLVLFKLPANPASAPSSAFTAASILVHLASAVIGADDKVAAEEEEHLRVYLSDLFGLSPGEDAHLAAHAHWLLADGAGLGGIKKRVETLAADRRLAIGKFLVTLANADGHIAPAEIEVLTKIYRLLGLDARDLYSHAHSASSAPVSLQQPEATDTAYAIPRPPVSAPRARLNIDLERVARMQAETEKVSSLLREIFVVEEEHLLVAPSSEAAAGSLLGLDVPQSAFLRALLRRNAWDRAEIEALALAHAIMLEGTLDAINDAAIEAFDECLLEGDDPVEVNPVVLKEIEK